MVRPVGWGVFLLLPTALLLVAPLQATLALPETEGPIPPSWRDVEFEDSRFDRGTVTARVYYPAFVEDEAATAEVSNGPYPLIAFMHGWTGRPGNYDTISLHLASWGFVVASIGTETGPNGNMHDEAKDTQALLHWVASQSAQKDSWLAGMITTGEWGASGHSMGGGACLELIRLEPKVQVIVPLQPYFDRRSRGLKTEKDWTGRAWFVAGDLDSTCPPKMVQRGFDALASAPRRFFTQISFMGHLGPLSRAPSHKKLSHEDQLRLHQRILGGFFRAELKNESHLYKILLGSAASAEPVVQQTHCVRPVAWWEDQSVQILALPELELQVSGNPWQTDNTGRLTLPADLWPSSTKEILISNGNETSTILAAGKQP